MTDAELDEFILPGGTTRPVSLVERLVTEVRRLRAEVERLRKAAVVTQDGPLE